MDVFEVLLLNYIFTIKKVVQIDKQNTFPYTPNIFVL